MPPKKRGISANTRDDNDSPESSKRTKTSSSTAVPSGKQFKDSEGNAYWELGGRLRRVTVSEFKGNQLISIREHYEKGGSVLPGKKGISLAIDQFNAFLSVLPQLDSHLAGKDVQLTRPIYGSIAFKEKAGVADADERVEEEAAEGAEEESLKTKKLKKKSVKSESDE